MKNKIWLRTDPTEHTGWIVVDAGRMTQAQISAVTMARAVTPLKRRRNILCALLSGLSNVSPVKKYIPLKRAPGALVCTNTNNDTTEIVIKMRRQFMTHLNRFSCSIRLNSID